MKHHRYYRLLIYVCDNLPFVAFPSLYNPYLKLNGRKRQKKRYTAAGVVDDEETEVVS